MSQTKKDTVSENVIEFADNQIVQQLVGFHNESLKSLESRLGIKICMRGNIMTLVGASGKIDEAETVLKNLYEEIKTGGKGMAYKAIDAAQTVAAALAEDVPRFVHISTPSIYVQNKDCMNIRESDPLPSPRTAPAV